MMGPLELPWFEWVLTAPLPQYTFALDATRQGSVLRALIRFYLVLS